MGNEIIRFEEVWKEFKLSKLPVRSLQDIFVFYRKREMRGKRHFWALKNINFEIRAGETVAILGENGSGKSTILKLVSRIIDPSQGVIRVNGRVSALLELGAGFHPDLSGRENIYLNGAILGVGRQEMRKKLDRIIEFAGMEEFIDVPIRNYSSGMQMRLGFSVAVHVEPEVILVDEVLAVGDYSFQRKCLKRIEEMQKAGVTIVFVSHDLEAVEELCSRGIWLEKGEMRVDGEVREIVRQMKERYHWDGEQLSDPQDEMVLGMNKIVV